jgi:hypothetical protein
LSGIKRDRPKGKETSEIILKIMPQKVQPKLCKVLKQRRIGKWERVMGGGGVQSPLTTANDKMFNSNVTIQKSGPKDSNMFEDKAHST